MRSEKIYDAKVMSVTPDFYIWILFEVQVHNLRTFLGVHKSLYQPALYIRELTGSRALELRDSGPCVVRKWRPGRPVPSVETAITRPNPVGDGTKWRVDTSVLSLRHTNQVDSTAVWVFFYDTGLSPVVDGTFSSSLVACA